MKQLYTLSSLPGSLFIGLVICLLSGCSGMLDDIRPKDQITQDQLTTSDWSKLLNGVYAGMEEFIFKFYMDGDVKGENFKAGPGFSLNDPMLMTPSSSDVLGKWQKSFTTLKGVNFLLEHFENAASADTPFMREVGGTAYYFRALIYYHLVTRWGGVPILRQRTYDIVPISSETEVWNFILDDLHKAESLLPAFTDRFYVSLSACQALMAQVYLSLKQYENAADYATRVISNPHFALAADAGEYARIFVSNTESPEVVFALSNQRTTGLLLFYQKVNDIDPTWDYAPADLAYENLYGDRPEKKGDRRAPAVFNDDPSRLIKFPNGADGQFVVTDEPSQTPIVVSRLAEMYLIKAEALGTAAGAATLKEFMTTRYASLALPAAFTEETFQDQILDERHREFYGEGQRWYDLKRTGRTDLFRSLNGRNYLMYFPVPQTEIDLAGKENYPQNKGY